MPKQDDTTTVVEAEKVDAPADPGMAEFFKNKNQSEESTEKDEKVEDETVKVDPPASEETETEEPDTSTKKDEVEAPEEVEAEDDSTAKQDQNRIGYQLRQIRAGDPFVARAKKALQNDYVNAEGISDEQREIRQMKSDNYIEKLETSRATLAADNNAIAAEYSFFRPTNPDGTKNPEFNEPLYKRAIDRFARDSLEMSEPDNDGKQEIVGYKVRLLDYMREEADLYLLGSKEKTDKTPTPKAKDKVDPPAKDDTKSQAEMDAASEDPGGASTTKAESQELSDPMVAAFLKGFDEA